MYALCTQIKSSDGKVCQSPALRGTDLCYFHYRWRKQKPSAVRAVPPNRKTVSPKKDRALPFVFDDLDTPESIQTALSLVATAIAQDKLDHNRASAILYAIQMANANLSKLHYALPAEEQQPEEEQQEAWELYLKQIEPEAVGDPFSLTP
ncbi:hypothetical protein HDF16_000247 [Granulicella aggregans]|uniref:Uncharacterized protein n=1 Tax=Granulicella aggregans TaxID=474949 RepID=A0A7W8E197_9BACT|nr:hypothetical protein [Granulicella aggregans]MBB5055578.1 hypothetical protein [Granulicella aggregans]